MSTLQIEHDFTREMLTLTIFPSPESAYPSPVQFDCYALRLLRTNDPSGSKTLSTLLVRTSPKYILTINGTLLFAGDASFATFRLQIVYELPILLLRVFHPVIHARISSDLKKKSIPWLALYSMNGAGVLAVQSGLQHPSKRECISRRLQFMTCQRLTHRTFPSLSTLSPFVRL